MNVDIALRGMEDAKNELRSPDGVNIPAFMSEHMDRLAIYTNAVEDHLAEAEAGLEIAEATLFRVELNKGLSPSAAEKAVKANEVVIENKATIKKLTRLVSSAWKLVDEKKSRFNHLTKAERGEV